MEKIKKNILELDIDLLKDLDKNLDGIIENNKAKEYLKNIESNIYS